MPSYEIKYQQFFQDSKIFDLFQVIDIHFWLNFTMILQKSIQYPSRTEAYSESDAAVTVC